MSNSAGFVSDVNVVPFDVGHDIDDSGTDVEEGLGVDEGDVLLCDAKLATMTIPVVKSLLIKPWKLTCLTYRRSGSDPSRDRDQEIVPKLIWWLETPEPTRVSSFLS